MRYLLIRHAQAEANSSAGIMYGKAGAPVSQVGKNQIITLRAHLTELGVDVADEKVAASELLRARQTAELAGFQNVTTYALLNEIHTSSPEDTPKLLAAAMVPAEATAAARKILAHPPKERVWVTHGLVIIALQAELGVANPKKFIPDYCEIREVEF